MATNATTWRSRSPPMFFLLVFALSISFWLAGAFAGRQLLPSIPVGALMFVCPVIAAVFFVYRENKIVGTTELLKRSLDFKRITAKVWYVPIIFLMPGVMVLSYAWMRLTGVALPAPQFPVMWGGVMFVAFFVVALGEELLVGICHRPNAVSLGRTASQHSLGVGVGRLAHRTVNAGSPIASMDRLVVSLNGRGAGTYRLAL
jgi:hypothetical protein